MPRIDVPAASDPRQHAWGLAGTIGEAGRRFSNTVHQQASLPSRVFEAARMRIAQINGCEICLAHRTSATFNPRLVGDVPDEPFYGEVASWSTSTALSTREKLAAEYAERFATDHRSFETDDAFWARFRGAFMDQEIVELTLAIGSFIAFGRFAHVLEVDTGCEL